MGESLGGAADSSLGGGIWPDSGEKEVEKHQPWGRDELEGSLRGAGRGGQARAPCVVSTASICREDSSLGVGLSVRWEAGVQGKRGAAGAGAGAWAQGSARAAHVGCGGAAYRTSRTRGGLWVAKVQECPGSASGLSCARVIQGRESGGRTDILNLKMLE